MKENINKTSVGKRVLTSILALMMAFVFMPKPTDIGHAKETTDSDLLTASDVVVTNDMEKPTITNGKVIDTNNVKAEFDPATGWLIVSKFKDDYETYFYDPIFGDYQDDIKYVYLEDGIETIEYDAFEKCENLEGIRIPDTVTSISNYAFARCDNLKSIHIPNSVASIGSFSFAWCDELETITFDEGIEDLDDHEGLETIAADAFYEDDGIKSITLPSTLKHTSINIFKNCADLDYISLPASAFDGTNILENNEYANVTEVDEDNCKLMLEDEDEDGVIIIKNSKGEIIINQNIKKGNNTINIPKNYKGSLFVTNSEKTSRVLEIRDVDTCPLEVGKFKVYKAKKTYNSVKLYWTKSENVDFYRIYKKVNGVYKITVKEVRGAATAKTLKGLKPDKVYNFKVKAVNNGKYKYSNIKKATTYERPVWDYEKHKAEKDK